MTKKKSAARKAAGNWWSDETVPQLRSLPAGIDADAFTEWMRPHLVAYRDQIAVREALGTKALDRQSLQKLLKHVKLARQALIDLTLRAGASLSTALVKNERVLGADSLQIVDRLKHDLLVLGALLPTLLAEFKVPAKRGRKPETSRDILLNRVIEYLRRSGVKAAHAQEAASLILVECRVRSPDTIKSTARAVKRVQKLPKKQS